MSSAHVKKICQEVHLTYHWYKTWKLHQSPLFRRPRDGVVKPLDEIKVAGAVDMERMIKYAEQKQQQFPWLHAFIEVAKEPAGDKWCGIDLTKSFSSSSEGRNYTDLKYKKNFESLTSREKLRAVVEKVELEMLKKKKVDAVQNGGPKLSLDEDELLRLGAFVSVYFQVPKTDLVERPILSLKDVCAMADPAPQMSMLTIEEIVELFFLFDNACTATGDFRHSFFQYGIPRRVRRFFAMACNDAIMYLYKVLPMGFSWTPAAAQAAAMLMWLKAFEIFCSTEKSATYTIEVFHKGKEEAVPGAWRIYRSKKGKMVLVAVIVIWIDNSFIIADAPDMRDRLVTAGRKAATEMGFIWKRTGPKEKEVELEVIQQGKPVEFLGVNWRRSSATTVEIFHAEKNVDRWKKVLEQEEFKTAGDVAAFVGILLWDTQVKHELLMPAARVIAISAVVAKQVERVFQLKGNKLSLSKIWRTLPINDCRLREDDTAYLKRRLVEVVKNSLFNRPRKEHFTAYLGIAADACGGSYGGRIMPDELSEHDIVISANWTADEPALRAEERADAERSRHVQINIKETLAICRLAKIALIRLEPRKKELRCLSDNTAAEAWVTRGISGNKALDEEILEVHQLAAERECSIVVLGIEGDLQVADEASRWVDKLDEKKRAICWNRLKNKEGRDGRKRPPDV